MTNTKITIDICMCTFKRPEIADALISLSRINKKANWALRIIVADNDETPSAKDLVLSVKAASGLDILYIHAPARNISIARNACLNAATGSIIAFIDDDEIATPEWLIKLIENIETNKSEVVLGPVKAIYSDQAPDWAREGDFHSTYPVFVNGKIITGYSCNVAFLRTFPALRDLKFLESLGQTGGEDTVFFSSAYEAGARISYAAEAWLTEKVTPQRELFSWLIKRRFRSGQTHGLLLLFKSKETSHISLIKNIIIALAKALFSYFAAAIFLPSSKRWRSWILRGCLHTGVVARLIGHKEIQQYGR